jgi:hypothetical protein
MTTPARRAEMVIEWKAQRLFAIRHRNKLNEDIRILDEMIGAFGESERGLEER